MAVPPTFFATPDAFRAWLAEHHDQKSELIVGFYKKDSGRPSITWPESVDAALSYGWIDGVRRSIDAASYCIRFTPRRATSIWSAVNIKRVKELTAAGLMHEAGLKAFAARTDEKSAIYAYEQRSQAKLDGPSEKLFRSNRAAWDFFQSQPAGYRKVASWWVISAKGEATRQKRLATLIEDSYNGLRVKQLRPIKTQSL